MTNKEDGDDSHDSNPRMAAILAVHLVSQVLDEAYVIANAARDSGQPWRYLSMMKNFKTSRLGDTDAEDTSFEASKGDCDLNENKMEIVANVVATSTPQKLTSRVGCAGEGEVSIPCNDHSYIGQGDESLEVQSELSKSTSMFISQLFDMSDVEHAICDDTGIIQSTSQPNDLITEAMNKMMESYVTHTSIPLETSPLVPNIKVTDEHIPVDLSRSDNSDYSFLADAFVTDISRDVAFYIDDDTSYERKENDEKSAIVEEIKELGDENTQEMIQKKDVALYENVYVTLNRDYDQGSEEDGFPVLQDPKGITLQEVELMTANTSHDDLSYHNGVPKQDIAATVSGVSGSRKSSLARRCRNQGARLLACFRGWWRHKIPLKIKDSRCLRAGHAMCPLSPNARRRASSLLDNRLLRSPSPSRPVAWKFNTVNETVVNSNRWKEYTFDTKPDDHGE